MSTAHTPLNVESGLEGLLAVNAVTVGVFVEFLVVSVLLTVLVMDRIGARQLRGAALLGGLGGTLFLAAHFVLGPMIVDLSRLEIKQVVLYAGSGTAIGLSVAMTMFRPSPHGPTSRGIERQNDDSEIEL